MAMLMSLSTVASGVNVLLILALLFVYVKNYKELKSLFTLGLIIFAALFLLQNLVSLYFYLTMMPLYAQGVETYVFALTVLQTLAFIILNWITWR